ncbi:hypothetical protein F383_22159 [Gossypium arboreum]|uniref:Uncharacterized protein n=1 Tax=Gossypium arboreum TaxID=29729 RepID=A0A0B0MNB3_GOSAR|nr:hypothetical protein F383_22159 [Gossypium arboreum]
MRWELNQHGLIPTKGKGLRIQTLTHMFHKFIRFNMFLDENSNILSNLSSSEISTMPSFVLSLVFPMVTSEALKQAPCSSSC